VARIEAVVAALRAGELVVLPTDTVYGLCAAATDDAAARRLYELKKRPRSEPVAVLAAVLDGLLDALPELRGRAGVVAAALLPGPYTLVVPNPARRYPWLTGDTPEVIGVRVPELAPDARAAVEGAGALAATSANRHGDPDPARLEDVPEELRAACGAVLDGGELPGTPSTVLDITAREPRVVREGAIPAQDALERVRATVPER
jgi:L-threonylcarbamoyladenylate synthase